MRKLPRALLAVYLIYCTTLAINPYDRSVWFAENLPIWLIVGFLVISYRAFRFSNSSYLLMSVFIFLHTLGGHFTFERVPFGFVTELFHFSRNHFDRVAHFTVGFYAFPIAEFLQRKKYITAGWALALFGVFAICTVAAVYEIVEWGYAVTADPAAGSAFLGSQGDPWDAQKDMLADSLGAVAAMGLFFAAGARRPAV